MTGQGGFLPFRFREQTRKSGRSAVDRIYADAVSPLRSMISIAASAVLTVITGLGSPSESRIV